MEIKITQAAPGKLKPKPKDESNLAFGNIFTDHLFFMNYEKGKGWFNPRIEPYQPICLDPAAMALHYGQEIFEGLKAYYGRDGQYYLFRPRENFKRMNRSAARLCMPELDIDLVLDALHRLISLEKEWIPKSRGTSLYIRPTMIATEAHLGVRPAQQYLFYIILGPVGAYYKEGLNPVRLYVEDRYVRAAAGGVGEAKTAGNYAASILAAEKAKEKGFVQVLWLDAKEHRYVEEVGAMNMFFVIDGEVITAPLTGTILPGITRDSVLHIAKQWGLKVAERSLAIQEIIEAAQNKRLQEAFGTGTAAIISPVGEFSYKDKNYSINGGKMGELSQKLYNELVAIQYAEKEDPFGWREKVVL